MSGSKYLQFSKNPSFKELGERMDVLSEKAKHLYDKSDWRGSFHRFIDITLIKKLIEEKIKSLSTEVDITIKI